MFYYNFQYIYLLIPAFILTLYAQSKVNSTFARYSKVRSTSGLTGARGCTGAYAQSRNL